MLIKKYFQVYHLFVRIVLIFLFVYAAVSKAIIFRQFLIQLSESPLIPIYLVSFSGVFIILLELFICGLLMTEKYAYLGLLASYSLMLFFSAYMIYILKFAPSIPCACGGILGHLDHSYHLVFNIIITLLIIPLLIFNPDRLRVSSS